MDAMLEMAKETVLAEASKLIETVEKHDEQHQEIVEKITTISGQHEEEKELLTETARGVALVQRWYTGWKHKHVLKAVTQAAAATQASMRANHAAVVQSLEAQAQALRAEVDAMPAQEQARMQALVLRHQQQIDAQAAENEQLRGSLRDTQDSLARCERQVATVEQERALTENRELSTRGALAAQRAQAAKLVVLRWQNKVAFSALRAWKAWAAKRRRMAYLMGKTIGMLKSRQMVRCFEAWKRCSSRQMVNELQVHRHLASKQRERRRKFWEFWRIAHKIALIDGARADAEVDAQTQAERAANNILRRWCGPAP
eukprot:SAG22_NODE_886_length_6665_cov_3.040359_4_plen_315_part_00